MLLTDARRPARPLEMCGETEAAIAAYKAAADRTNSLPEQRYLTTQAARLKRNSKKS